MCHSRNQDALDQIIPANSVAEPVQTSGDDVRDLTDVPLVCECAEAMGLPEGSTDTVSNVELGCLVRSVYEIKP